MSDEWLKRSAIDAAIMGAGPGWSSNSVQKAIDSLSGANLPAALKTMDTLSGIRAQTDIFAKMSTLAELEKSSVFADLQRQLVAKPIADWNKINQFRINPELNDAFGIARESARKYELLFRLPEKPEIFRLAQNAFQHVDLAKRMFGTTDELQRSMLAMRSPWLQTDVVRSSAAFSELVAIGRGVSTRLPFEDELASSLRNGLGDWRDTVTPASETLLPLEARTAFYVKQGYDVELTNFTSVAFDEALRIGGLESEDQEDDSGADDEVEQGLARAVVAFAKLQRFEIEMRRFIAEVMTAAFGAEWMQKQLPGDMLDKWKFKKNKAEQDGRPVEPLIHYADFTDFLSIMDRGDNWNAAFKPVFRRPETMRESFQRLFPVRIATMHARVVSLEDWFYLLLETHRIRTAIGRSRSS